MLLWVAEEDYRVEPWRYKRRNTVLGLWHQIKKSLWNEHLDLCLMVDIARQEVELLEEMEKQLPVERAELSLIVAQHEEESQRADLEDIPF
jgi:hypothetical protein